MCTTWEIVGNVHDSSMFRKMHISTWLMPSLILSLSPSYSDYLPALNQSTLLPALNQSLSSYSDYVHALSFLCTMESLIRFHTAILVRMHRMTLPFNVGNLKTFKYSCLFISFADTYDLELEFCLSSGFIRALPTLSILISWKMFWKWLDTSWPHTIK